jgi:hypothetical protein
MIELFVMAVSLLLLGAGFIALRGGRDVLSADPQEPDTSAPDPVLNQDQEPVVTEPVEPVEPPGPLPDWDIYIDELCGDVDPDFLRRWITIESGGNPCSVGSVAQLRRDGYAREAGLGQLYFERRDQVVFGATLPKLRGACSSTTQDRIRPLTEEEKRIQVTSLVSMAASYLGKARALLAQVGENWNPDEINALAKLYHALPALYRFLPGACAENAGGDWYSFKTWACGRSASQANAINTNIAAYMPFDRLFSNAERAAGMEPM